MYFIYSELPRKKNYQGLRRLLRNYKKIISLRRLITNFYISNNRASTYMKQELMKLQVAIDKFTITDGNFNTSLSVIDRSTSLKFNKDRVELDSTINQLNIIDIYRLSYPTKGDYYFFSQVHTECLLI